MKKIIKLMSIQKRTKQVRKLKQTYKSRIKLFLIRKNIKQNQLFNSKWIDFTLIDGYDIRVFNFNNDHILTWTKDFYHFAALYKNNQLYYITKLFDSQKVERHKNWILLFILLFVLLSSSYSNSIYIGMTNTKLLPTPAPAIASKSLPHRIAGIPCI